jgi:hypothetical protein
VALGRGQDVQLKERADLAGAASSECADGHLSVALERSQAPTDLVEPIRAAIRGQGLSPAASAS